MRRRRERTWSWSPAPRPVLVMEDGGTPIRVSADLFGLRGRERGWGPQAENFVAANRELLEALQIAAEFAPGQEGLGLRLRAGGTVGAVPLRAPDTRKPAGGIVVQPRFGWEGIGGLLQRIGWAAAPELLRLPAVPGSARQVPAWVLAGPILQRFADLLEALKVGFRLHEETRETVRGQVLWGRYLVEQTTRGNFHRLPCRFPELGPDLLLLSHLRWGLEHLAAALRPAYTSDLIARRLTDRAEELVERVGPVAARPPDHGGLLQLGRSSAVHAPLLQAGLEALGWLVDQRGLAGASESDGLAWRLPMPALFERWVEHLTRCWAHGFGAEVRAARDQQTTVPVRWNQRYRGSLSSLIPDLVARQGETVYIVDAKYKEHFEELDEREWNLLREDLKEQHRHDVHQALAYAALFQAPRVVTMLVYPLQAETWRRLAERQRTVSLARLDHHGRELILALAGVPLNLGLTTEAEQVVRDWEALRLASGN